MNYLTKVIGQITIGALAGIATVMFLKAFGVTGFLAGATAGSVITNVIWILSRLSEGGLKMSAILRASLRISLGVTVYVIMVGVVRAFSDDELLVGTLAGVALCGTIDILYTIMEKRRS